MGAVPSRAADDAMTQIADGATVVVVGSGGGINEPSALLRALEARFLGTGHPRDLTLYHANGLGSASGGGTDCFAHEGFVAKVYGSHWSWAPRLTRMAQEGRFETAVWPQGVLAQLLREAAGQRPGLWSPVGVGTYLDPSMPNQQRPGRQLLPIPVDVDGRRWLFYQAPSVDVTLIRATSADDKGNLTMEEEGVILEVLAAASAAKANGGRVVAQVKRRRPGVATPRDVRVPGCLVDDIVVEQMQRQSSSTELNLAFVGEVPVIPDPALPEEPARLLIAARAAQELRPGMLVNVGFGVGDAVPRVAMRTGLGDRVTFSIEQGPIGGIPAWGDDFGLMWNPTSIIDAPAVFDLYDSGYLDAAFLSFAEVDAEGNVNVTYFGDKLIGPGGFMNITRGARSIVFCGTTTARNLKVDVRDGMVHIIKEGSVSKFIPRCQQISFNADEARRRGQRVLYVTERAVFALAKRGIELVEVAAGIDVERDVLPALSFRPAVSDTLVHYPPGLIEQHMTRSEARR